MITLVLALRLSALPEVLHKSCNVGTRDLPDMYALSPRALGIHTVSGKLLMPMLHL